MDSGDVERMLSQALKADRFRLRRLWQRANRLPENSPQRENDFKLLLRAFDESIQRRESRERANPTIEYDPELPISNHRTALIELIQTRQTIVVCGATGSGKSTQLPKICLEAGRGREALIGHTQPRRLAARSIANRLAEELQTKVGEWVGFKIRFTDRTQPNTLIKLMTDGVLLAETQRDRFLDAYDTLIIDEAHERSLNIDLLLGYLRRLLDRRRDLKLIITSATIDAERFAEHFADANGPAPIMNIEGRTYPVEIRYRGAEEASEFGENDWSTRLMLAVDELTSEGRGDILVFLPSERDIRDTARHLRGHLTRSGELDRTEILPLYARLTEGEQQKIFQTHRNRRIVLATNVAESSLTVPGIRYVIDAGTARISRYAPRSKVQRLPIEAVAQASADQRAGRCGRLGPGICIRLYSESDYLGRAKFTTPEIRRTNLASAILQTQLLGVGDLDQLPLIDPPRPDMIRDGMATLREINAIDLHDRLTDVGRRLGRWPVDPRVGRMLIEADKNGCLADVLVIASGLEVQDPRLRPPEKQQAADQAHAKFVDPQSDFLSLLRVWDFYHKLKEELGRSRLERACHENFLSLTRLREWADVHRQLMEMCAEHRSGSSGSKIGARKYKSTIELNPAPIQPNRRNEKPEISKTFPPGYDAIHLSLLTGLWSGVAMLDEERKYKGAGGIDFQIWPGSGLKQIRPKWIVAAEVVETHQRYGRTVAAIDPAWIEPLAEHLLKSSYEQPHFSRKNGSAMVYRKASLFGLPVVLRKQVALAKVDPEMARKLLIEVGLVERELVSRAGFYQHNCQQLDELQAWANRTRRRDFVVDSYKLQQFYEQHLPEEVVDRATLEKWDRGLSKDASIRLRWEQLVEDFDSDAAKKSFPTEIKLGETKLALKYHFEPGAERDGVSLKVPQVALAQLSDQRLQWLVPGLLEEKLLHLIKSLPKQLRRNLVPAPDTAAAVCRELLKGEHNDAAFWPTVCQQLSKIAGEKIEFRDFQIDKVPSHLQMHIEVVDDSGKLIESGRDLSMLQSKISTANADLASQATKEVVSEVWSRKGMMTFDIETLPESIQVRKGGVIVNVFPTLVVDENEIRTDVVDRPDVASRQLKIGILKLYASVERRELRSQVAHLPQFSSCQLRLASRIGADKLQQSLSELMARIAFTEGEEVVRTRDDFELRRIDRMKRISVAAQEIAKWLPRLAEQYHSLALLLEKVPATWKANIDTVRRQLDELFADGFMANVPWVWLREYPRYLQAIVARIDRLKTIGPTKDIVLQQAIDPFWKEYLARLAKSNSLIWPEEKLLEYRWMIEEYRVSTFAQQLGTRVPVSQKRLEKFLSEL